MSKGQFYLTALTYLTLKGQLHRLPLFLPVLGGGNRGHINIGSPPPSTRGVGGRWLAGFFLVLRPFQHAGGGQETALTQDNLSYILSCSAIIKWYIHYGDNLPNNDDGQFIHPLVPFPHR
jgi:hypothetical protein